MNLQECKIFPLNTGFRYVQFPFMTGFTLSGGIASLLSTDKESASTPTYLPRPRHAARGRTSILLISGHLHVLYIETVVKWCHQNIKSSGEGTATTGIWEQLSAHKLLISNKSGSQLAALCEAWRSQDFDCECDRTSRVWFHAVWQEYTKDSEDRLPASNYLEA